MVMPDPVQLPAVRALTANRRGGIPGAPDVDGVHSLYFPLYFLPWSPVIAESFNYPLAIPGRNEVPRGLYEYCYYC